MSGIQSFGVIGGDKRQIYCGQSMAEDGYDVCFCGLEQGDSVAESVDVSFILRNCDAVLLPLPCSRDGVNLHTPLSELDIPLQELSDCLKEKPVFCGMKHKLPVSGQNIYDYSVREEFAVENAVPTAEGAIELAIHQYDSTINGSECLVTGYGRIGRVLSHMLSGLGAKVTVSTRNLAAMAFIRAAGMKAIRSDHLIGKFDLIFNTVPFLLFDAHTLARTAAGALVIDLASLPGGVDFEAARRLAIPTFHALSLPGKTAPKTSGIIIKNAVYHIIEEEQL